MPPDGPDGRVAGRGQAGEPGVSLESKLVHIGLIKIDGQRVYPELATDTLSSSIHNEVTADVSGSDFETAAEMPPPEQHQESATAPQEQVSAASF